MEGRAPGHKDVYNGERIYGHYKTLKNKYRKGKLAGSIIKCLVILFPTFIDKRSISAPTSDLDKLGLFREFHSEENRPPTQKELYRGQPIGTQYYNLKRRYIDGKLDPIISNDIISIFPTFSQVIELKQRKTDLEQLELLKTYHKVENKVPTPREIYKDEPIRYYYDHLKKKYNDNKLNKSIGDELVALFPSISTIRIVFPHKSDTEKLNRLKVYFESTNRTPMAKETYNGENIGQYFDSLKQKYYKGTLDKELTTELTQMSPSFAQRTVALRKTDRDKLDLITMYFKDENRIPTRRITYDKQPIGQYYNDLVKKYRNDKLDTTIASELKRLFPTFS